MKLNSHSIMSSDFSGTNSDGTMDDSSSMILARQGYSSTSLFSQNGISFNASRPISKAEGSNSRNISGRIIHNSFNDSYINKEKSKKL